jgi:hypothetical protein
MWASPVKKSYGRVISNTNAAIASSIAHAQGVGGDRRDAVAAGRDGPERDRPLATRLAQSTPASDGSFSATLPLTSGAWVATVTAMRSGATAHRQLTVTVP